jgi:hypothetical protein
VDTRSTIIHDLGTLALIVTTGARWAVGCACYRLQFDILITHKNIGKCRFHSPPSHVAGSRDELISLQGFVGLCRMESGHYFRTTLVARGISTSVYFRKAPALHGGPEEPFGY